MGVVKLRHGFSRRRPGSRRDSMSLRSTRSVGIALITFAIPAHAQLYSGGASNSISVNGDAEVRVVPDEVMLTLGVETFDKVLKVSKKMNDERVTKTIAAAKSHGIAAEQIQTDYIGIEPRYQNYDVSSTLESSFGYWSSYGSWWNHYGSGVMQNVVQNMGGASVSTDNTLAPGQIAI